MNNDHQYEHLKREVETTFADYIKAVESSSFESIKNVRQVYELNRLQSRFTQANLAFKNFIYKHTSL